MPLRKTRAVRVNIAATTAHCSASVHKAMLEPHDGGDGEGPQRVPRVDDERQGGDPRVVERRVVGRGPNGTD